MSMEFAKAFSALRRERGLSQKQAAEALGISQALLSHYENGLREPRLKFVVRACDFYGVSADFMLGRMNPGDRDVSRSIQTRIHEEISALQKIEEDLSHLNERLATSKMPEGPVEWEFLSRGDDE